MTNHGASGGSECYSSARGAAGGTKQHSVSAQKPSVSDEKKKKSLMLHQNWFVIPSQIKKCIYFENVENLCLLLYVKNSWKLYRKHPAMLDSAGMRFCSALTAFSGQLHMQHL